MPRTTTGAREGRRGAQAKQARRGVPHMKAHIGVQTLIVDDFPSTHDARALSPNGRAHWATKNAARKGVASEVVIAATQQGLRAASGPVRLTFRYVFPDQRKRDVDNLTTGVTKVAIDALVRGRWLAADDSAHVVEVKAEAVVEPGSRRLVIVIEPLPVGERAAPREAGGVSAASPER